MTYPNKNAIEALLRDNKEPQLIAEATTFLTSRISFYAAGNMLQGETTDGVYQAIAALLQHLETKPAYHDAYTELSSLYKEVYQLASRSELRPTNAFIPTVIPDHPAGVHILAEELRRRMDPALLAQLKQLLDAPAV